MGTLREKLKAAADVFVTLRKEKVYRLLLTFLAVVTLFGIIAYLFEHNQPDSLIKTIGDGIWWGFVTISTTGYGDKYPVTTAGRMVGILTILSGMVLTIIVSGAVASILVERKMKEGKGLQKINTTGHIIVCGWNQCGGKLLQGFRALSDKTKNKIAIVLVSELEIDVFSELQFTYSSKYLSVEFIRGDFAHEPVLENANIRKAKSVIIVADTSGPHSINNADERTVLAAYTISNLSPGAKISVELFNSQNEQYLKRTNVENIIVNGEFNSYLLINSALYPGVPQALKEIMTFNVGNEMVSRNIPPNFVGKTFTELFHYMRERENSLLIGIISETRKLSIDDFLSEDPSSIDEFIKRKFAESEKDMFADTGGKINVMLNPGWNYVIQENDKALLIGG